MDDTGASQNGTRPTPLVVKRALQSAVIGLMAGAVGSLIGAGGGIVLTPMLTAAMGLTQKQAHGTALVAVAMNSLISAVVYRKGGSVAVPQALILCLGALSTSYFGAMFTSKVDSKRLKQYFGVFLLFVAGLIAFPVSAQQAIPAGSTEPQIRSRLMLLVSGCLTGFLSGLLGIGGGTIMVPSLIFNGFGQKVAQGTALMAMILPSMLGCVGHFRLGHVQLGLLPGLLGGVLVGAILGGNLAVYMPDRALKLVCGSVFFLMGIRYAIVSSK
ncbi:putative membrane transporter protein [Porphyridium purpureum]|uniref:Putative membrane transporter protein n=1 Tax=Porphyridium purpureum TaxID=35688 RepID=A0A5J4Z6U7_PORPP|nr:putative membrane transporter protein [Porphyridium purpureum]|eukprot:POR2837..scf295_1